MAPAIYDEVHVTVTGADAVFAAKGSRLAFDGFLRAYNFDEEKEPVKPENAADGEAEDDDAPTNKQLPPLKVNEAVKALKITPQQHFTKPPLPYSEALLVKALEQHGVGRPSTYAATVGMIKKRGYVEVRKRRLFPTELGREVHTVLATRLPGLFEVPFTAAMESALDEIAAGEREGKAYLKAFWQQVSPQFGENVVQAVVTARPSTKTSRAATTSSGTKTRRSATTRTRTKTAGSTPSSRTRTKTPRSAPKPDASDAAPAPAPAPAPAVPASELGVCPKCGKPLVKRTGPRGAFVGCSGFPKCRFTRNLA
jgi:DNA topoisomerase-1